MIESINGIQFGKMITAAAGAVEAQRQLINELNVFPVPDGDTGTNMSLTMGAAVGDIRKTDHPEIGKMAEVVAGALLRGARGNSGVILSLLFRGFSKSVKEYATISGPEFACALQDGVDAAYRAVMKPAEGTVLTVSRVGAARAIAASVENPGMEYVLEQTLLCCQDALLETVNQNPVLQKAGVIDAGAKGYCVILEGMLASLLGKDVSVKLSLEGARDKADFAEYSADDIRFGYCTEFIIRRSHTKKDPIKLRALLGSMGDSLVFVDDDELIKVHVHTDHPGRALEEGLAYGSLTSIKIDNMRDQHTEKVFADTQAQKRAEIAPPTRPYGFVAVCAGDGLAAVLRDLGVDNLVEGGQTMNPSTEDILRQIDATPAETVFVLPNNKNIILAAEQCVPLSEKKAVVLPSRSVPQGIAALLAFDASLEAGENREAMISAMSAIHTGSVTYAARQSNFDGALISEGDHIALLNGQLLYTHSEERQVLVRLADEISRLSPSYITIFFGEGKEECDAAPVAELFEQACPASEVTLLMGGQPVYSYLISAE